MVYRLFSFSSNLRISFALPVVSRISACLSVWAKIKFDFAEQRSPTDDEFEGVLQRKHEWESTTKKASNRSWHKVYMVVRGQSLFVYTDQKSYKAAPDQPYKGESPLDLRGATITVASDYTKKKHVFRVKWASFLRYTI